MVTGLSPHIIASRQGQQNKEPTSSTSKMADDNPEDVPPVEEEQQEEEAPAEESEGPKRIVICGATGRVGGSVLRRLQSDGGWEIRAVTRTPDSDVAAAIADSGVEVVAGNYDDEESLITAFEVCIRPYPSLTMCKLTTLPGRQSHLRRHQLLGALLRQWQ